MRPFLVVPVLLGALVAAAACSAGADGGSPASGGASPSAGAASYQQFAACMREHGQDVPDIDPETGNVALTAPATADRSAWDAAMRACQQFLPGGGEPAAADPQQLEGLRLYAACMREHGVEMTDPDPNTGKSQFGGRLANVGRDQIVNDPTYKAADAACKDKLPADSPKKGGK